jgi:hypothetical protein
VNPASALEASTAYYAEVETGTLNQKVDANGLASPTGTAQPLVGLRTGIFTTAAA